MIAVEEYLHNPDYKRFEYVDGEVLALNLGACPHSSIQVNCGSALKQFLRTFGQGRVLISCHCRLLFADTTRFRQPDVSVSFDPNVRTKRYLEGAPDFVIEIRSPDDTLRFLVRKLEEYFANGCKLAWLIFPEEQTVEVFTPNGHVQILGPGETLNGGDVLPGLAIPVNEVFE
jgi:Uma2 family endonuclease